ncbi:MAG: putative deoxyribonuclease [Xanthobacteraceae bacterium]|nr:MAG: putative deoxyribonuclease [Xanthobacteraceae bacterium]
MKWSPQQDDALLAVRRWMKDPSGPQVFRLFGYAGTGKSTLALELASGVSGGTVFCAFTGKAALVMRRKGCKDASTVHGAIYSPVEDEEGSVNEPQFVLNPESPVASAGLVILDECSMIGEDLGRDLLSFKTKVLVLGDPAQLPPVKGEGYFTGHAPDIMLTEIHRQAADNPIVALATKIRQGQKIHVGSYGQSRVVTRDQLDRDDFLSADQVLVGRNKTRENVNAWFRQRLGRTDPLPVLGDRLVCLRNDREKKILNGELFDVVTAPPRLPGERKKSRLPDPDAVDLWVRSEDAPAGLRPKDVRVRKEFFLGGAEDLQWSDRRAYDEFTYGYALTVHKAQGSQWDNVLVCDESSIFRETRMNHLYTAVTRAAERVTVVMTQ